MLLEDPPADAVRAWTPEGLLVFSTEPQDQVGSAEAVNDELIAAAVKNGQATAVTTTDLLGNPQEEIFVTYTAIPAGGPFTAVVQIDYPQSHLLDEVRSDWMGYRIVLGLLALAVLLLAIFSLREPTARVGAGVPFVPESVPRGETLIETDELVTLKEAGAVARRRVEGMEERLKAAEEERWKLEGQLQQALSATHASEVADIDEVASPTVRPAPVPRSKPAPAPMSVPVVSTPEPEPAPEPKPKKEKREPETPLVKAQEEPRPAPQPEPRPAAKPEPPPGGAA